MKTLKDNELRLTIGIYAGEWNMGAIVYESVGVYRSCASECARKKEEKK